MIEANLFPAIPCVHVQCQSREVTSMSDFVHNGHRPRIAADSSRFESGIVFGTCYVLFLFRAIAIRLLRRREQYVVRDSDNRQSIFGEARTAARVVVVSSFMGL
jgi:hypothetical protein